jgi:hypothetical protein
VDSKLVGSTKGLGHAVQDIITSTTTIITRSRRVKRSYAAWIPCLIINGLILDRSDTIMALIDDLKQKMDAATASIQRNSDLDDSIITMLTAESQQIKDLKAALEAAGTDPQKLQELADAMDALITKSDAEATKKADAVTANTPAA